MRPNSLPYRGGFNVRSDDNSFAFTEFDIFHDLTQTERESLFDFAFIGSVCLISLVIFEARRRALVRLDSGVHY